MAQRGDSEIAISAWSHEWLAGSGASCVAEWFLGASQAWKVSRALELKQNFLSQPLDVVRTSGYAEPRADILHPDPSAIPVVYEMSRLRKDRGGPLEERIVEFAASVIPCTVGLHAVDIRRPVPESTWSGKRNASADAIFKDVMAEFRAMCESLPIAWAICSTFGRGPSVAELYKQRGASAQVEVVYLGATFLPDELDAVNPCRATNVGAGVELAFTTRFGGPMAGAVSEAQRAAIWKSLRRVSISGMPWNVLKELG